MLTILFKCTVSYDVWFPFTDCLLCNGDRWKNTQHGKLMVRSTCVTSPGWAINSMCRQ